MNKFIGIENFLLDCKEDQITICFSQIEEIIGTKLCKSAYQSQSYWIPSSTHMLANAIVNSGFKKVSLDLYKQEITLRKENRDCDLEIPKAKTINQTQIKYDLRLKPTSLKEEILITAPNNLKNLDLDEYLMVKINKHNSDLIEECIKNDSRYKPIGKNTFEKHLRANNFSEEAYYEIINRIATENSTRTSKEVMRLLAKYICDTSNNFLKRLEDGEPKLVDDMLIYLMHSNQRKDKSLVSKVCKYLNEWKYGKDSYTINDSFIRGALPYYLAYHKIDKSLWKNKKIEEMSYADFFNLFDELKNVFPDLNRHQLDHLIWYSYKNDPVRYEIIKALASII